MVEIEKIEEAIADVKKLKEQYKNRNGDSSLRIPNKDMNLWMIGKLLDYGDRISKVEAKVKMLMFGIGGGIPLLVFILSKIY